MSGYNTSKGGVNETGDLYFYLIASGSAKENTIKIWDLNSGKIIGKLEGHDGATLSGSLAIRLTQSAGTALKSRPQIVEGAQRRAERPRGGTQKSFCI